MVDFKSVVSISRQRKYPLASVNCPEYAEAIDILNNLQPTVQLITLAANAGDNNLADARLQQFRKHVERCGISQEQLTSLNVVHVSGTKGKGSVCAFVERILRSCGYKTGFFSSPHLIDVVERIRINGEPITQQHFADSFREVYRQLSECREDENDFPPYFFFVNLMAFKVFLQEKVDVAVFEVGLGGTFDSTNVIDHPVVCGVTALDYDHLRILGSSIEEIAWNKAGIFKQGSPAFTGNQKFANGLKKLQQCAEEIGVQLEIVQVDKSKFADVALGLDGEHQFENASLAIKLCETWLWKVHQKALDKDCVKHGLENVRWPGRCQIFTATPNATFYLDGAHTAESLKLCRRWFEQKVRRDQRVRSKLVLMCTFTSERNDQQFLKILNDSFHFDHVVFTPPSLASSAIDKSSVTYNAKSNLSTDLARCNRNSDFWKTVDPESIVTVCSSINESVEFLLGLDCEIQVLVTGSLYLIGGCLKVLQDISNERS